MNIPVHVLGVGSPIGDDRIGWVAIERLLRSERLMALPPATVRLTAHDRPGASLLAAWQDAGRVLIIDGLCSGATPGTLMRLDGERLAVAGKGRDVSAHAFGVAAAVALARSLGDDVSRIVLHGIEIDSANQGESLSAATQAALPYLVASVEDEIMGWLHA